MRRVTLLYVCLFLASSSALFGQTAVTTRSTNLRRDPSTQHARIRLLAASEQLKLLSTAGRNGYYPVETVDSTKGWVLARNVRVDAAIAVVPKPDSTAAPGAITIGPPVPGTNARAGCGDGRWQHVYHPYRLLVMNECATVSGTIVDASNGRNPDGVRHEADGDTHGWLQLDPQFANLLNDGNRSAQNGKLVFEIVCHYPVTQADARPACSSFGDHTAIPRVGSHVRMTGAFVQDTNHARWNEIHPISSIVIIP